MNYWMVLAVFCHTLGLVAFGGGLMYYSLILAYADRHHLPPVLQKLEDNFRFTSMGMSVGLTLLIFGGLLRYFLVHGRFSWSIESPYETASLLKALLFLCTWIYWGWFEVVTMHPFRQHVLLAGDGQDPSEAYLASRINVRRGLRRLLILVLLLMVLGSVTQVLG